MPLLSRGPRCFWLKRGRLARGALVVAESVGVHAHAALFRQHTMPADCMRSPIKCGNDLRRALVLPGAGVWLDR
jgi:hypothetical protein